MFSVRRRVYLRPDPACPDGRGLRRALQCGLLAPDATHREEQVPALHALSGLRPRLGWCEAARDAPGSACAARPPPRAVDGSHPNLNAAFGTVSVNALKHTLLLRTAESFRRLHSVVLGLFS